MPATWSGFLSFGLISIPIELSPAARSERISFNQLHSVCRTRIKQPTYCPTCQKFIERSEIIKGYEYEKDQYLLFEPKDFEAIEPESAKAMEILSFVKAEEIDPVYFDSSYYATPDEGGEKAYHLLLEAMRETGYSAIAKITMHGRENIVIVRARENGFTLHTMFYKNEVRAISQASVPGGAEVKPAEAKLAVQLIESLASPFDPDQYSDSYQVGLEKLIEAKAKGLKLEAQPHVAHEKVIDLMAALKQSLEKPTKKGVIHAVPQPGEKQKRSRKVG